MDASGARGVQVGDHSTQVNNFGGQSPAAADLQALHPRAAAKRIRGMPAEDGASLIAQLTLTHAVDLLEELLLHDEPVAVAVLTGMHPARAQELVTLLAGVAGWLADLPRAAAEIHKAHDDGRAALGAESGTIGRIKGSEPEPPGFVLNCSGGIIFWTAAAGAAALTGPIHACFNARDGLVLWLGRPLASERDGVQRFARGDVHLRRRDGTPIAVPGAISKRWWAARGAIGLAKTPEVAEGPSSLSRVEGSVQCFEDPAAARQEVAIYARDDSDGDAVAVFEPILSLYRALDGPVGWLGLPSCEQVGTAQGDGAVQDFEGGVIVLQPGRRPLAVPLLIYAAADARRLGVPVGPVQQLGGGSDQAQFFEKGLITVRDGTPEAWTPKPAVNVFADLKW